jgi:ATP-dependent exoDNAse (exonuclease V) beta subunit
MHELLSDKLAAYSLNATHLTNFLDLSRKGMETFIEENLIGFPQPASDVLANGNAMHAAMELAQIQTTNGKLDLAAIKRLYNHKLGEENLTSTVLERLTSRAYKQLDALFGEIGLKFSPHSKPEQSYSASTAAGLSLYGKIDRVDTINDNTIRIVDYKTGKPITNPASKAQDVLLKQWRHRLQLGFYILLIRQQKLYRGKQIQAQIIQLDATASDHLCLNYEFDEQGLIRIEQLALAVFKHIKALDIPHVSAFEPNLKGIADFEDYLLK